CLGDEDLVLAPSRILDPIERALVSPAHHLRSADTPNDLPAVLVVVTEHGVCAAGGEDEGAIVIAFTPHDLHIVQVGVHGEGRIRYERPWGRRPDEDPAHGMARVRARAGGSFVRRT